MASLFKCDEINPPVIYYNASQSWDNTTSRYSKAPQVSLYGATWSLHGIAALSNDARQEIW